MELQSGFVLAVLVAAVLLADRIGGAPELARRLFQVALGVLIAFTVVGGTAAFIRMPEFTDTDSGFSSGDSDSQQQEDFEDIANRNSAKSSIHVGAGVVALVLGIAWLRRLATLSLGVVLAGLLLILFGGVTQTSSSTTDAFSLLYSTLLGAALGSVGQAAAIAHFVMLLGGSLALFLFGYTQWERPRPIVGEGEAAV